MKNIRGMSLQLFRLLMIAGICAVSLFVLIHSCSDLLIGKYFSGSDLQLRMIEKRIESFGDYVLNNSISATDTVDLLNWCDKQPMVLMEVYRGNILYFNSSYFYTDPLSEQNIEAPRYNWYSYYEVEFADGPADVLLYSDESYILNSWVTLAAVILSGVLFIAVVLIGIRKPIRYVYQLCDEIQIMGSGDLEHPVTVRGHNELSLLAEELDHMRSALFYHRQKEQEMIRQNNDMITGLSHDLRTPLTKLLLYAEIIQNERYGDKQQLRQYLTRICEKGAQMKEISDHLLQYSLAQGEARTHEMRTVSFRDVFFDRLSEMADYLSVQGFTVECDVDWSEDKISINELYLDRILDNIVSNIDKYAEKACPVKISSIQNDHSIGISVKNNQPSQCRPAESSGVGIESIRAMMQQMKGSCILDRTETVFEITVTFPTQQL